VKNTPNCPLGRLSISGRNLLPSVNQITSFSRIVGLFLRAPRKILPQSLFVSLLSSVAFGERSCRAIALQLGITSDISASRQAVWQRLGKPAIALFIQKMINHVMGKSLVDNTLLELRDSIKNLKLKDKIKRVLIGDASTFTMHPSLADVFPGSKNGLPVPKAHLKIQLITDLLTGRWVQVSIDSYGRSDAKAALDFMAEIQAGDLLIRDLGYAVMASFKRINDASAFFISRLKARVYVLDEEGKILPLRKELRRLTPNPGDIGRRKVLMTKSDRVPCEMVVVRVPQAVADERRRKLNAKHDRQGFKAPTKRYLELQDWTILVTNVPENVVSNEQIIQWYLMRWRIELIFKACKSHTGMLKVVGHKTNQYHAKALVLTWVLAMILLAHRGCFEMARITEVKAVTRGKESAAATPGPGESAELRTGIMMPVLKIEIVRASIFKSMGRLILALGFEIELAGCGGDFVEHGRRIQRYFDQHNQTETPINRTALADVLKSALTIEN
jgi:hypothetical protein